MVKFKSIYLTLIFAALMLLASVDVLFMKGAVTYKLVLLYSVLLTLGLYVMKDVKMEKEDALASLYFLISIVMISAGQYVYSFHLYPFLWLGTLFMAAGLAFIGLENILRVRNKGEEEERSGNNKLIEQVTLFLILGLAFFLRVYKAGEIPPGVWFDEAQNGNEVIEILKGKDPGVFVPRYTMMPAMFFYIASVFVKVFGVNIGALRLVAVFAGVLSIASFYFLLKYIFKDIRLAVAGAFLLAVSRWHINFSRVAFLGMLTVLLELICFYFYLRMLDGKKRSHAVIAGASMGLNLYTFTAANFIPLIITCHVIFLALKERAVFLKKQWKNLLILGAVAIIVAMPLIQYAARNFRTFSMRVQDVSIMNDIKSEKSLKPLLQSVITHFLMFNFEGDYNGRHNLYKKPMVDNISGVLLACGFFMGLLSPKYAFFIIWALIMLLGGILTISVEAPQAYRIIGMVPVLYIFILLAAQKAVNLLSKLNKNALYQGVFLSVLCLSIAAINIHQYFVLYPHEKATYMSFSPEANGIATFINKNSSKYDIFVSIPNNMYGFYPWEQLLICDFLTRGKVFYYIREDNSSPDENSGAKTGAVMIVRPSDEKQIGEIEKEYKDARKEVYANPFTDEVMYICYYIDRAMIKIKKDPNVKMILHK